MRTIEEIRKIFVEMEDETFEKLNFWADKWIFGEAPKARFNYWLKKAGLKENEYWAWCAE